MSGEIVWMPSRRRREQSRMAEFVRFVNGRRGMTLPTDYEPLRRWSVESSDEFWRDLRDFFSPVGDFSSAQTMDSKAMPGANFFVGDRLNFAENMLQNADGRPAIVAWNENGRAQTVRRDELKAQVLQLAGWLRQNGVAPGDAVAAYMPNIPETVIAMLAASAVGAVFSSCSMDFGMESAAQRLGQVAPKILFAADGYVYNGRSIARANEIAAIAGRVPSIKKIVVAPFLAALSKTEPQSLQTILKQTDACIWKDALEEGAPLSDFVRLDFNAPLLALFSSGTTGAPKCILHRSGGVLLQHLKELALHCDIRGGDRVFYFTTCGWMMWNWLLSALALEAAIVLYEGHPARPPDILWQMAAAEEVSLFGASAKYLDGCRKGKLAPGKQYSLPALRTICSTGSPLSADGFDYVYKSIKEDAQLASISGGTDLVSCFALGNPLDAVRRGELQGRGLGMAVEVFDDSGRAVRNAPGELVCVAPFPAMPLGFAGDEGGGKYRAAYFEYFPDVWRHGDWATLTEEGGMVIHGRSDATLNPGGVRIGTAEIYRPVESFAEVEEALAVGQEWGDDSRVILFVRLAAGAVLDDNLRARLRAAVKEQASPRHAPAKILVAPSLPRTRSGKLAEIAVREIIHNRPVRNAAALANPDSLAYFQNLPELREE